MRRILLVVLLGCHAAPSPHEEPAELTLETAGACAKAAHFDLEIVTGTAWRVRTDAGTHVIDTSKHTCDDAPLELKPGAAVIDLLAAAAQCAQGAPWNGVGTSKSPLDLQHPIIHRGDKVRVEYPEAEPRSKPSGAELAVEGDHCTEVPRE